MASVPGVTLRPVATATNTQYLLTLSKRLRQYFVENVSGLFFLRRIEELMDAVPDTDAGAELNILGTLVDAYEESTSRSLRPTRSR
jgi:hypothetical protein